MKNGSFIISIILLIMLMNCKAVLGQNSAVLNKRYSLFQRSNIEFYSGNKHIINEEYFKGNLKNSDTINEKDSEKYFLTTKINLFIGYNGSEEWGLYYFPFRKYKYFINLNYQFFTTFSPKIDISTYGLLNEIGVNLAQLYYKIGIVYYLNSNFYLNANLGLSYTLFLGGSVLNDLLFGARCKIKNNIFLQMEGGINNLISIGTPFNTFLKIGIGHNL